MAKSRKKRTTLDPNLIFYHNTTNINGEELRQRMDLCKSQTMEVYELAKDLGTIWRWKLIDVYEEYRGHRLLDAVASRALSDLRAMGYLIETGEKVRGNRGALNVVYKVNQNPPVNPIKIPKKICVELKFTENEDGDFVFDPEGMNEEWQSKLNYWTNILLTEKKK